MLKILILNHIVFLYHTYFFIAKKVLHSNIWGGGGAEKSRLQLSFSVYIDILGSNSTNVISILIYYNTIDMKYGQRCLC